jgi:CBS domain-containing protein
MQVQDVMTSGVECADPDMTLQQAAQKMQQLDVGLLPVCGNRDKLVGMVSDRDIVIRGVASGKDPRTTEVREVMTPEVLYCFDDQDVTEAAQMMTENQIRRLVVLNRDKRLAGIVSLGDLAVDSGDAELVGNALAGVSEPAAPIP